MILLHRHYKASIINIYAKSETESLCLAKIGTNKHHLETFKIQIVDLPIQWQIQDLKINFLLITQVAVFGTDPSCTRRNASIFMFHPTDRNCLASVP